jgi:multidrug efflux pump subunit AcrA (membrane-fusion protein)
MLAGVVLLTMTLAMPMAHAQDPVSGALATLAAATVQAQYRQASQRATWTASAWQAAATAQVAQAQVEVTRQAQAIQVTEQAMKATGQAFEVEATQAANAAQARATMQAQIARATETAYQQEQAERERQERVARHAELFLYAALGLGFAVILLLCWRVYRTLGAVKRQVVPPATPPIDAGSGWVIEGEYSPADQRGLNVTLISDPDAVDRFEQYVMENGL